MATLAPPVDYTSRDFSAIKEDLIAAVQAAIPAWTGEDPNDFLRILLEGVAFVGDNTNYYLDRVANEALLTTATSRASIIKMARAFGYSPSGPIAASVTVTFANTAASPVTVPQGTLLSGTYNSSGTQVSASFETTDAVTVPANGSATVTALEGLTQRGSTSLQSTGDPIGVTLYRTNGAATSDGSPDQEFVVNSHPVIEGSTRVWVHAPGATDGTYFTYVPNLVFAGPDDRVYTVNRNADDSLSIIFGDGANGYIPPAGYTVKATYRLGGGTAGNVPAGTVVVIRTTPTGGTLPVTLGVTNTVAATGGVDTEDTATMRRNAALTFRTRDRAVSTQDFSDLVERQAGAAWARAIGNPVSNVAVYVAPFATAVTDVQPGYAEMTATASTYTITTNVATINTAAAHGLATGQVVNISSNASVVVNGTWTVASTPTGTSFTFACTSADTVSPVTLSNGLVRAIGAENAALTDTKSRALTVCQAAAPAGCGITIGGPVYTDLTIKATVQLFGNVGQSTSRTAIQQAVLTHFDLRLHPFAESVYTAQVMGAIAAVTGVQAVQVTTFARSLDFSTAAAASGSFASYNVDQTVVTGAPYEIFRVLPQNVTITVVGGIPDAA